MHDVTLVISPQELAYLIRCVQRELVEYEESSLREDLDDYAMLEATRGEMVLRMLTKVARETDVAQ